MTIQEMKRRKKELGLSNQMVAERSGVPLGTVQKIFGGATKAPRKETIDALIKALYIDHHPKSAQYQTIPGDIYVKEPATAFLRGDRTVGEYTLDDYYALPDDERVELIDGVFYDMASPMKIHQGILGGIYVQLDACVEQHPGTCFLYAAPSDVELGEDRKTVVQPDIYIHCDPDKEQNKPHHGAPDFIVEILSPSSRGHDLLRKHELYKRHGVREYWVVDPKDRRVAIYDLVSDALPYIYSFEDEVPVLISEGTCKVDFKKVFARVKHFYEE